MPINTALRRIAIGIASLAVASTAFAGTAFAGTAFAGTAHAEDASTKAASDCPKGWFCVWSGDDYTGRMQKVESNNADLSQYAVFNGGIRSYYNNGNSCDVKIYKGKNYTSTNATIKRGARDTAPDGASSGTVLSNKWVNCT